MNYQEALEWIHGKLKFGIKPGLERMQWMLDQLGNPQQNISAVHVVGTNGKGSTTSYLQHIFSLSGYEVGTFTSPYIVDFRERISINGQMISELDFISLVERLKPVIERLPLETNLEPATELEVITLLMFEFFGHVHPIDIAIIEAGMGGLYDSTNVFKAIAVVCPSIGLDHQPVLGDTYVEIAEQKVGVLKEGVPFIFATERDDVRKVFENKAQETNSPLFELRKNFYISRHNAYFDYQGKLGTVNNIALAMPGNHQISNASLTITAALLLEKKFPNVMIDGAHNNESVAALVDVLKGYSNKKIHILFAAIDTKPVASMLEKLSILSPVQVANFDYPNALALEKYPKGYQKILSWHDWIKSINRTSSDDFYVITGSLYFISQVRLELLSSQQN